MFKIIISFSLIFMLPLQLLAADSGVKNKKKEFKYYISIKNMEHLKKFKGKKVERYSKFSSMKKVIKSSNTTFTDSDSSPNLKEKKSKISLNKNNLGRREYEIKGDGKVSVSVLLKTYGNANLSVVIIKKNGQKVNWLKWNRKNDSDNSPLIVNGKADTSSIKKVKNCDFSPIKRTLTYDVKKGDKIILNMNGNFGAANPLLIANINETIK